MNAAVRKLASGLAVAAVALAVSLTVAPEAKAAVPPFNPWSPGPAQGAWFAPNQMNWRAGPYGAQYNWNNNGGFFSQAYGPGGVQGVYEQNQFYRGQRIIGPGGNHGWVETPFLPGVRLTW